MYAPTQHVRGRIGQVVLHPELEQALLSMERGETRIVRVHFGLDYPFAPYRGKAKLIRLTLIDHKPFGFPPVIEDEVFQNDIGGYLDTTTITDEQNVLIREIHAA
jgi:FKBP-type peptidyl-prolyl cis-trans isomerase (trigger factor)